jgi:hypothetical protein
MTTVDPVPADLEFPFDPENDEVPRGMSIGVEQEYKWRLPEDGLQGNREPKLGDLAVALPLPHNSQIENRFQHTQSTVYFDDEWQLSAHGVALRATVNPGTIRRVSWLGVKQTLWWENGCRDSLEISGRLDAKNIGDEIRNEKSMMLGYINRMLGKQIAPDPFAVVVQRRHRIFYRNNDGILLQLTFDVSDFQILPDRRPHRTYWLEIENNNPDPRARAALTQWAGPVSERLGAEPASQAKSELAAELAGWVSAR